MDYVSIFYQEFQTTHTRYHSRLPGLPVHPHRLFEKPPWQRKPTPKNPTEGFILRHRDWNTLFHFIPLFQRSVSNEAGSGSSDTPLL